MTYQSSIAVDPFPNYAQRVIVFGIPSALIVYGLVGIESLGRAASKPLSTLGDWSYSLYLSHVLTLSVLGYIWTIFAGKNIWDNVILLPIFVTISALVSGVLWYGIEKPLLIHFSKMRERLF